MLIKHCASSLILAAAEFVWHLSDWWVKLTNTQIYPAEEILIQFARVCVCVQGCKTRDHIVNVPDEENCDEETSAQTRVLNDLLLHRDAVCVSNSPSAEGWVCEDSFTMFFFIMCVIDALIANVPVCVSVLRRASPVQKKFRTVTFSWSQQSSDLWEEMAAP